MKRVIRDTINWDDAVDAIFGMTKLVEMKRVMRDNINAASILPIFGMANLVPKRTGLKADIWSPHRGGLSALKHNSTRVKIEINDAAVEITVEPNPKIKAKTANIKHSDMKAIREAMEYVGRNCDLFLRHIHDSDDEFDDADLFEALRKRGDYR